MASCSKALYHTTWQTKQVSVDGKTDEWDLPLRYAECDGKMQYIVTNDSKNLYLCVKSTDDQLIMTILRNGMHIWIDTIGKNQELVGIEYPFFHKMERGKGPRSNSDENQEEMGKGMREAPGAGEKGIAEMLKRQIAEQTEMVLTGFKPPLDGIVPVLETKDIKVKINIDELNSFVYEAVIPFKTFIKPELAAADTNRIIGITIKIEAQKALSSSNQEGGPEGGPGGDGGGMGGPGGGGPGGGGPEGGPGGMSGEPQSGTRSSALSVKIEKRFKLSYNK